MRVDARPDRPEPDLPAHVPALPQQSAFRHLERIVAPPPVKMSLGVAAHRAAEHNYSHKIESHEDEPEDSADAAATEYRTASAFVRDARYECASGPD